MARSPLAGLKGEAYVLYRIDGGRTIEKARSIRIVEYTLVEKREGDSVNISTNISCQHCFSSTANIVPRILTKTYLAHSCTHSRQRTKSIKCHLYAKVMECWRGSVRRVLKFQLVRTGRQGADDVCRDDRLQLNASTLKPHISLIGQRWHCAMLTYCSIHVFSRVSSEALCTANTAKSVHATVKDTSEGSCVATRPKTWLCDGCVTW